VTDQTALDAIELLTADHRKVDQLFDRLDTATGEDRTGIVCDIVRELSIHAAIEEQLLYPTARKKVPSTEALVDRNIREHQQIKELLADIEKAGYADAPVSILQTLKTEVRQHVEEEETQFFPQLRQGLTTEELAKLGEALAMAKKAAPTHPHPHAPSEPPGNIVAGIAAAVVDRARDLAKKL
jgi:hemerythrin superfamily protein